MYGRSVCLLPVVFVVLCVAFMVSGQDLICKDSRQFGDTFVFQLSLSLRTVCYNLNWTAENEAIQVHSLSTANKLVLGLASKKSACYTTQLCSQQNPLQVPSTDGHHTGFKYPPLT